jgi:hypothetical protein
MAAVSTACVNNMKIPSLESNSPSFSLEQRQYRNTFNTPALLRECTNQVLGMICDLIFVIRSCEI